MPAFRTGASALSPYQAGRPIEEVARDLGVDPAKLIKLASNESPVGPFPEVIEAVVAAASGVNRYPDNDWHDLAKAMSASLGLGPDQLMFGGGSSELLRVIALSVGGAGTSALYAWPSFIIYRMATALAGAEGIEVPLSQQTHDLEAMLAAIRPDTTVAYVCNPNNPTGTHVPADAVVRFIEQVPERVLVVIDEAYHEYVTAADYRSAIPEALLRPNVVVTRTFSKVYGLAGLRVGYAVGQSKTLLDLRRAQAPFTVNALAQVAATAALRFPEQVQQRVRLNAEERTRLEKELAAREVVYVPSQANFVYVKSDAYEALLVHGVIARPMGDEWIRVTIGAPEENERFLAALDEIN